MAKIHGWMMILSVVVLGSVGFNPVAARLEPHTLREESLSDKIVLLSAKSFSMLSNAENQVTTPPTPAPVIVLTDPSTSTLIVGEPIMDFFNPAAGSTTGNTEQHDNLHQSNIDQRSSQDFLPEISQTTFPSVQPSNEIEVNQIMAVTNPRWQILVLIYRETDFTYTDGGGIEHQVVASMTQAEIARAVNAATRFVENDVPILTSGNQFPILTIRYPDHALTELDSACGYWPSQGNTAPDRDPAFDSVIVIWDSTGVETHSNQPENLQQCGGLALYAGTGQTYAAFQVDSVSSTERNIFKHEWGHSILFYFDAANISPKPAVDNHINDTTIRYVHCPTGTAYILQDENDNNPIPNSIYHNERGFTHDYYSGTTATPDQPTRCLGITPEAWATGGPVTRNNSDEFDNARILLDLPYTDTQHIIGTTTAFDDPSFACLSGQLYHTVWYRYTPTTSGILTVNTYDSSYDTVLGLWTGSRGNLQNVGCNDDTGVTVHSELQVPVVPGTTYSIEVASFSSVGFGTLKLSASVTISDPQAAPIPNHFTTPMPTFTWSRVSWATGYQIQVDNHTNFSSPVYTSPILFGSSTLSHTIYIRLQSGTYYWRIRARRSDGSWGSWSRREEFAVSVS